MSRSKARKLWKEKGESSLSNYQRAVLALRSIAKIHYLPLGKLRTGNAPNDLLGAWKIIVTEGPYGDF